MITLRSGGWVRLLFVGCLLLFPVLAVGKTLTVSAGDKGGIASALAAAHSGDVILVGCGVYPEGGLFMPDGVTLSGAAGDASCVRIVTTGVFPLVNFMGTGPTTRIANLTLAADPGGLTGPVKRGGGVYLENSSADFSNVIFEGLEADYGGAVYCGDGSSPVFSQCVFDGNYARAAGGAIACTAGSSPYIESCLFTDNAAEASGGTINAALGSAPQLYATTIVRGDGAVGAGLSSWDTGGISMSQCILVDGKQGRAWDGDAASVPAPECTDIFGNAGGDWVGALASYESTLGNISAAPQFCGTADPDNPYTLNAGSPCAVPAPPGCGVMGAYAINCNYVSDVGDGDAGLPVVSRLHDNYPNPFNPRTTIKFDLKQSGVVDLAVFDIAGRLVERLVSRTMTAGSHEAVWDGRDSKGYQAAAGVYFFRLKTADTVDTKRMTLVK